MYKPASMILLSVLGMLLCSYVKEKWGKSNLFDYIL